MNTAPLDPIVEFDIVTSVLYVQAKQWMESPKRSLSSTSCMTASFLQLNERPRKELDPLPQFINKLNIEERDYYVDH
ncbi:hypothetical protein NPIL_628821 [Nephila pilipes]|uniref:Uncharacterized protein n=1 Tax=Nephila pilipes TaxID=299642 RepID=A0A8X6QI73_NEPPI|nr:hypothetical protein NPIL_628821 [Nephila pilipes]